MKKCVVVPVLAIVFACCAGAGMRLPDTVFAETAQIPRSDAAYAIVQEESEYVLFSAQEEELLRSADIADLIAEIDGADGVRRIGFSVADTAGQTVKLAEGSYILEGSLAGGAGAVRAVVEFSGEALYSTADITNGHENSSSIAFCNSGTGTVCLSGGTIGGGAGVAVRNEGGGKICIGGETVLTSENEDPAFATVYCANGTIEATGGRIENTSASQSARVLAASGAGNIFADGAQTAFTKTNNEGVLINNLGSGNIVLGSGTFSVNAGIAVNNASDGEVIVNGGTVSAKAGTAIGNSGGGRVTVRRADASVSTRVTSGSDLGAAILANSAEDAEVIVEGGTVENTEGGAAIYANTSAAVDISITGGTVRAEETAVEYAANGVLCVSGGTVEGQTCIRLSRNGAAAEIKGGMLDAYGTAILNAASGSVLIAGGAVSGLTAVENLYAGAISLDGAPEIDGEVGAFGESLSLGENFAGEITVRADESELKNGDLLLLCAGSGEGVDFGFVSGKAVKDGGRLVYVVRIALQSANGTADAYATADGKYPELVPQEDTRGFALSWSYGETAVKAGDALLSEKPHTLTMSKTLLPADLSAMGDVVVEGTAEVRAAAAHDLAGSKNFTVAYEWFRQENGEWRSVGTGETLSLTDAAQAGEYKLTATCTYTEGDTEYSARSEQVFSVTFSEEGGGCSGSIAGFGFSGLAVVAAACALSITKRRKSK